VVRMTGAPQATKRHLILGRQSVFAVHQYGGIARLPEETLLHEVRLGQSEGTILLAGLFKRRRGHTSLGRHGPVMVLEVACTTMTTRGLKPERMVSC